MFSPPMQPVEVDTSRNGPDPRIDRMLNYMDRVLNPGSNAVDPASSERGGLTSAPP